MSEQQTLFFKLQTQSQNQPNCPSMNINNQNICKCDIRGASHTRSSNAYNIKCKLGAEKEIDASYEGETGDNLQGVPKKMGFRT